MGALAGAREARALEGEHCVTNHGDLAPCMSGGGQACCDAVRAWETNGCFCDGVSTSLDATQTAGAVSFASSCSIVRTTDASDSLCAVVVAVERRRRELDERSGRADERVRDSHGRERGRRRMDRERVERCRGVRHRRVRRE